MVFIKHNSLKSDINFNPIFIPCFSGSSFFLVQVFLGPAFSRSRFFRVWVQGPGLVCVIAKEETLTQVFSCKFCEISKNTFFHRSPPVGYSKP